ESDRAIEIVRRRFEHRLQRRHLRRLAVELDQPEQRGGPHLYFPALISVHILLRKRRWAAVRSFNCSSFARVALSGKIAWFLRSSGSMYWRASMFGLPEPMRLVSSAEFLPSSMKFMNRS